MLKMTIERTDGRRMMVEATTTPTISCPRGSYYAISYMLDGETVYIADDLGVCDVSPSPITTLDRETVHNGARLTHRQRLIQALDQIESFNSY